MPYSNTGVAVMPDLLSGVHMAWTCLPNQSSVHALHQELRLRILAGELKDLMCLTSGGFWDAVPNAEVAADGTEVTPSGLRPSRGPSSTPTLPALTAGHHFCTCPFAM